MRTLKEQIVKDADVFINLAEFGREMVVDGCPAKGVWADTDMTARAHVDDNKMSVADIDTVERLLYLKPPYFGYQTPRADEQMTIDDVVWTVADALVEGGIIKLNLYRHRS